MKMYSTNTCGFKGVQKRGDLYVAQIRIQGKQTYLGKRPTAKEAHELYAAAAKEHFGEFARMK